MSDNFNVLLFDHGRKREEECAAIARDCRNPERRLSELTLFMGKRATKLFHKKAKETVTD
jgi:hypothetical protein